MLGSVAAESITLTVAERCMGHRRSDGAEVLCLSWNTLVDRFAHPSSSRIDAKGHEGDVPCHTTVQQRVVPALRSRRNFHIACRQSLLDYHAWRSRD